MVEALKPDEYGKPTTVRLGDLKLPLEGLALVDGLSFANEFRAAVGWYIHKRQSSPDFPEQVKAAQARQASAIDSALGSLSIRSEQ